ncbi:MAG: metallophosphoesterase [Planctomycetota bacterium]|nr:metallophosphoesterase [Planctomycetota bacterium]
MSHISKPPRRFPLVAIRLFGLLRWLGSVVWPGKRAYRHYLSHGGLELTEEDVPVANLPPGLDGLRVVQISDLHAGPFLDRKSLDGVLDLVRASRPDVLVITGDFITKSADDMHELGSVFMEMPAALGKFAVFGNHDYHERREGELVAALRRQGVTVLRNASVALAHRGAVLRLVGLEDIEEGRKVDLEAALKDRADQDGATVLLCHHPDVSSRLPKGVFDLVLSGHTHGGQVRVPGAWRVWSRWLPEHLDGTRPLPGRRGLMHVNRGLGVLVLPVRIGARPQVSCLTLRPTR